MEKSSERELREIQLESYLPAVVAEIREFRELTAAENPEFTLLFKDLAQVLDDNFVSYASVSAIRRYETMLGIRPSGTIEERRREILIHYNRQLPYTLLRLKEMLAGWVGAEDYEIDTTRFKEYQIEIILREQQLSFLQFLKRELREIIPANLIFDLAGEYRNYVEVPIDYESRIEFISEFFPRKNANWLFLDGTWFLDGTYFLDGREMREDDYYRTRLRLTSECKVDAKVAGMLTVEKDLWILDGTYALNGEKLLDAEVMTYFD